MDKTITSAEAGRKGGNKILEKYGRTYFSTLGKKGGRPRKNKNNKEGDHGIGREYESIS